MYSHRNGDTLEPAISGMFFFEGKLEDEYGGYERYSKPTLVSVDADDDYVSYPGFDEYGAVLSKSNGIWWGPIEVPSKDRK